MFYLILWPFKAIGLGNPFFLAFVARLASSLFAVFVSLKIYRYFAELFKFDALERGQFYLLNLALFFVPFFHARSADLQLAMDC